MKLWLLKQLMKMSGGLAAVYIDKVNQERMEEWLMALGDETNGYKDYYTLRKKSIQETMVSGLGQEEYWITHGRILELQYMNGLSKKLLKNNKDKKKKA